MQLQTSQDPTGWWRAIDLDTYDCDCDENGFFCTDVVGDGRTEAEAIEDLIFKKSKPGHIICSQEQIAALDWAADAIKVQDGGDPSTETGWKSDEALTYWLAVKSMTDEPIEDLIFKKSEQSA